VLTRGVKRFVPWLQLTVSGLMFSVLFFAVQQNWTSNALAIARPSPALLPTT
jgi:hypothetical protein